MFVSICRILYCEKCLILLLRPPDRSKLMELKSKDLQDYLNKRNISTYGLVGKRNVFVIQLLKTITDSISISSHNRLSFTFYNILFPKLQHNLTTSK